jgi:hypothetical protein
MQSTQTQPPTPRHMNRLQLRDLSASPDARMMERVAERRVSEEDAAILAAWQPSLCITVRLA